MKLQTKILQNQEIEDSSNTLKKYIHELIQPYTNQRLDNETDRIYDNMKKFTKDNSAIIIGALDYNMLIGFIWGYITQENNKRAHVNYFFIKDEYRSKGIGKLLVEKMEEKLSSINIKELELLVDIKNEKAINFYSRNGFQIEEKNNKKLKLVKKINDKDN